MTTPGVLRSWTLPPMTGTRMTSNDRFHWAKRAKITKEWREMACVHARAARIPRLDRAQIVIHWLPQNAHGRDAANLYPLGKAAVDGICLDAGVLADDDSAHLVGPDMRLGARFRPAVPGRGLATLRIVVTELPA
jgi:crossover junction endodeoxyribonuclease RusA